MTDGIHAALQRAMDAANAGHAIERLARRLVLQDDDSGAERLRVGQSQRFVGNAVTKRMTPFSNDHRVEHQPILIDQIVWHQRLNEASASIDQKIAARRPL